MKQESLFEEKNDTRPLADRMRPETLDEYVGQKQLVDKGNILWKMKISKSKILKSLIGKQ